MTEFQTLSYTDVENCISADLFDRFDLKRVLFVNSSRFDCPESKIQYKQWNIEFRYYFDSGNCYVPNNGIMIYDIELEEEYDA